jgi:hypothetical protein
LHTKFAEDKSNFDHKVTGKVLLVEDRLSSIAAIHGATPQLLIELICSGHPALHD